MKTNFASFDPDLRYEGGDAAHAVGEDDGPDERHAQGEDALDVRDRHDVAVAHGRDAATATRVICSVTAHTRCISEY